MKRKNVIGIGELLWDILPTGKVLGGAPLNFAFHVQQLGALGTIISAIGNDELGAEINSVLQTKGVNKCLSMKTKPTGTASVEIKNGSPNFIIHQEVAWDYIELTEKARNVLRSADALCFGTLAQRNEISRKSILEALEIVPHKCLKVFDINLRQHYFSKEIIETSLGFANVLKLNDSEIKIFKEMFDIPGDEEESCTTIIKRFGLKLVALTKGANGSSLYSKITISKMNTPKVKVVDSIGAGDAFSAAMVMGLLNGKSLYELHKEAVNVSAFVCTKSGATPSFPSGLNI